MRLIKRSRADSDILQRLIERGLPTPDVQPTAYGGVVVMKPWGYELQVFDNGSCCLWLACLKPGEAVSMHCHQRKRAMFLPLSGSILFRTLDESELLTEGITVSCCVFHSQENSGTDDAFFLEYEWPSEKSDLVRYKDRYGRETKGYEGVNQMIPLAEAFDRIVMPDHIRALVGRAA